MKHLFRTNRRLGGLLALFICCLTGLGGCAEVTIERGMLGRFDAYRLSNETYEAWVVPSVGRVMWYGEKGGQNVLWTSGLEAMREPARIGAWVNWGGDKVWIAPQEEWKLRTGRAWPPPGDPAAGPSTAIISGGALVVEGPTVPGYGLRVVREFRLSRWGSALTMVNRLEQVEAGPGTGGNGVSMWTVTQVARSTDVALHDGEGWRELPRPVDEASVTRPGDALRARVGGFTLEQRLLGTSPDTRSHAKIFWQPDTEAATGDRGDCYMELELIAAPELLRKGDQSSWTTRWTLTPAPGR